MERAKQPVRSAKASQRTGFETGILRQRCLRAACTAQAGRAKAQSTVMAVCRHAGVLGCPLRFKPRMHSKVRIFVQAPSRRYGLPDTRCEHLWANREADRDQTCCRNTQLLQDCSPDFSTKARTLWLIRRTAPDSTEVRALDRCLGMPALASWNYAFGLEPAHVIPHCTELRPFGPARPTPALHKSSHFAFKEGPARRGMSFPRFGSVSLTQAAQKLALWLGLAPAIPCRTKARTLDGFDAYQPIQHRNSHFGSRLKRSIRSATAQAVSSKSLARRLRGGCGHFHAGIAKHLE